MALARDLSEAQINFQVDGCEPDQFSVSRYRGTDGLCQLYRFEIEMAAGGEALEFDNIVGKAAVLSIAAAFGTRWFHGVVSRFELTGETEDTNYYRAELVPTVWLLTHRYNSRIFQKKNVVDIVCEVLTGAGIPTDRVSVPEKKGDPKEYCVQYRETDYNFICRLMEEAGIRWYFEQSEEAHVLVLENDTSSYPAIEGEPLPYVATSGMNPSEEAVHRIRIGQSVRPGAVALTDFNFTNPKLDLMSTADCGRDTSLEFYDFPGRFVEQTPGGDTAAIRAEEFETFRIKAVGRTNSHRLAPGQKFELTEHTALAGAYLVTGLTHQGKQSTSLIASGTLEAQGVLDPSTHQAVLAATQNGDGKLRDLARALLQVASRLKQGDPTAHRSLTTWLYHAGQVARDLPSAAQASGQNPLSWLAAPNLLEDPSQANGLDLDAPPYECIFECIPAATPYRPPRVTPWPVMRGCQTARVVGAEGEEIECDEYGRVKVQFHWDRYGNEAGNPKVHGADSSCFIRVSQGWAGGKYGMMFIPRIGQEVIVDFIEGDPDQPIIVGRVYNSDHMPPYDLPDEKTKSVIKSTGSLGCSGNHEIRFEDLEGEEQLFIQAQRQMDTKVKGNSFHTIDASYHLSIGTDKGDEPKGEYLQLVEENKHVHVKIDQNTKIDKNESRDIGGTRAVKVGGDCTVAVGGNRIDNVGKGHKHDVKMVYALKALGVKIEASTGIELKCGGCSIVLTPAAIFIKGGPLVNINTGAGPPVTPPSAKAGSPTKPEEAEDADSTDPGSNSTYGGGGEPVPGTVPPEIKPRGGNGDEEDDLLTYLEFQLLDAKEKDKEEPVANEPVVVLCGDEPLDGAPAKTDGEGVVRITDVKTKDVSKIKIQYRKRYDSEWKEVPEKEADAPEPPPLAPPQPDAWKESEAYKAPEPDWKESPAYKPPKPDWKENPGYKPPDE